MAQENRRAFLRKLAKGAAYTAPVVCSMAAPVDLIGQGKGKSSGKGKWWMRDDDDQGSSTYSVPAPGSVPPGG